MPLKNGIHISDLIKIAIKSWDIMINHWNFSVFSSLVSFFSARALSRLVNMVPAMTWSWDSWLMNLMERWSLVINLHYPLVNIQKTMENHHFYWENSLFLWSFSIAMLKYQRVTNMKWTPIFFHIMIHKPLWISWWIYNLYHSSILIMGITQWLWWLLVSKIPSISGDYHRLSTSILKEEHN